MMRQQSAINLGQVYDHAVNIKTKQKIIRPSQTINKNKTDAESNTHTETWLIVILNSATNAFNIDFRIFRYKILRNSQS